MCILVNGSKECVGVDLIFFKEDNDILVWEVIFFLFSFRSFFVINKFIFNF